MTEFIGHIWKSEGTLKNVADPFASKHVDIRYITITTFAVLFAAPSIIYYCDYYWY